MTADLLSPARAALIAALHQTAETLGRRHVTCHEFHRHTGLGIAEVRRHFKRYGEFVRAAGLEPIGERRRLSEDELLQALREAIVAGKGAASQASIARLGRYHPSTYRKRWGNWASTLLAFTRWLEHHEPGFPYLRTLHTTLATGGDEAKPAGAREPRDTRTYGRLVEAGGFHHAPVNEQGVVFLFGALAARLGFMVEAVGTGFPDCVAKRRVDRGGEVWTRVRIEFEHRSRNFRLHKHPPESCDLIVCWQHDWPDCPLEVLELRKVVGEGR